MKRWLPLLLALVLLLPASSSSTGSLTIPHTIFTQAGGTNVAPLLDQNFQAIASYINAREVTFGLFSARPVAGVAGRYFFATDLNGGTMYADNGTTWLQISAPVASSGNVRAGLALANNGAFTATFTVAVGAATSDDAALGNRVLMPLTAALTKNLQAWAVGTNQGCLAEGTVATFTWYHVFLIQRLDTGVSDVLCSTTPTSPTMPTNYSKKRYIGSVKTDWSVNGVTPAGSLYFFSQTGREFRWATGTLDINNATPGTSAVTATVNTPNGIQTLARLSLFIASGGGTNSVYVSDLAVADQAPSSTLAPLASCGGADAVCQVDVITDTANTIRYRASINTPIRAVTYGYLNLAIDKDGPQP